MLLLLAYRVLEAVLLLCKYPHQLALGNLSIDSVQYISLSKDVLSQGVASIIGKQPPLFIWLISWIARTGFSLPLGIKVLNAFSAFTTLLLIFLITFRLISRNAAYISVLLYLVYPSPWAYIHSMQYESCAALLVTLGIFLGVGPQNFVTPFFAGLSMAGACLIREPAIMVGWIATVLFRGFRQRTLYAASFAGPVVAWIIYASLVGDHFIPISSKSSGNFEMGFNPNSDGGFNATLVSVAAPSGLAFIAAYPLNSLYLIARKIALFFGFISDGWLPPSFVSPMLWRACLGHVDYQTILTAAHIIIPLLAFIGAVIVFWVEHSPGASRRNLKAMALALLLTALVHSLYIGSPRFLLPFIAPFIILAALPAEQISRKISPHYFWGACIFFVVAVIIPANRSFDWRLEVEDMDGHEAQRVDCENCSGHAARRVDNAKKKHLIAFVADQYLPAGHYTAMVGLSGSHSEKVTLELYDLSRKILIRENLKKDADDPSTISAQFTLQKMTSAAIAFRLGEGSSAELDWIRLKGLVSN